MKSSWEPFILYNTVSAQTCMGNHRKDKKRKEEVSTSTVFKPEAHKTIKLNEVIKRESTYKTDVPNKIIKRGSTYNNIHHMMMFPFWCPYKNSSQCQ